LCLSLGGSGLVLQAAFSECQFLDLLSYHQDLRASALVDIGRGEIAEALVVAVVVVVIDEGADLLYQVAGLSSPRRPARTILIFSSAEYCLRVLRLIPLTNLSAASFDVPDFLFIFAP
jgi:hypothetical protein